MIVSAVELKPELITTENNDYYGFMNEFKGFQCQAKGTNLKYSWRHNDIIINDNYILKFPKTNASTLKPLADNIGTNYEGHYQCFVTNSIGTIFGRKTYVQFTSMQYSSQLYSQSELEITAGSQQFTFPTKIHFYQILNRLEFLSGLF